MGKTISLYFLPGTGPITRIFFYWDDNSEKRDFLSFLSTQEKYGPRPHQNQRAPAWDPSEPSSREDDVVQRCSSTGPRRRLARRRGHRLQAKEGCFFLQKDQDGDDK
jgi:hypothetical protein